MNHDLVIGSASGKTEITDFWMDKSVLDVLFVTYLANMNDPSGLASPTANIFPMEIIREKCHVVAVVQLSLSARSLRMSRNRTSVSIPQPRPQ